MNTLVVVQQVRPARTVSWSPTLALFSLSLPHQSVCASEVSHVRLPADCTHLDAAGLIIGLTCRRWKLFLSYSWIVAPHAVLLPGSLLCVYSPAFLLCPIIRASFRKHPELLHLCSVLLSLHSTQGNVVQI